MVAPWIQARDIFPGRPTNDLSGFIVTPSTFLTYTPSGFAAPVYTPLPISGGTGTEIVDVGANSGVTSVTLPQDTSIYALRTSISILNPDSEQPTLHILSGGLIAETFTDFPFPPLAIQPNVDFGNTEAFMNVEPGALGDSNWLTLEIDGAVHAANGITKFGSSTLRLANPNNTILGPITILEGTLELAASPIPHPPCQSPYPPARRLHF